MPLWETHIYSYNKKTTEVEVFMGDYIEAISPKLAQQKCYLMGKGYLVVTGMQIIGEVSQHGKEKDLSNSYLQN